MNIETLVLVCLGWAGAVILFFILRGRKLKFKSEGVLVETGGERDIIEYPKSVKVNVIFENEEDLSAELVADMTVKVDELISGNYTVPDALKPGYDAIGDESNETVVEEKHEATGGAKQKVEVDKLINISELNK